MKRIKQFFKSHWLVIVGVSLGAVAGYMYWLKVGCSTGTCPITSSPTISTIWGAIVGGLLADFFNVRKAEHKKE